jgi:hypothetical protein
MKKYKVYWSFWNLVQPTQKEVSQLQTIWTGFSAPIIASTFIASDDRNALISALLCGIIDKAISCLYLEEVK